MLGYVSSPSFRQGPHPQRAGVTVLVQPQLGPRPVQALPHQLEARRGAGGEHEAGQSEERVRMSDQSGPSVTCTPQSWCRSETTPTPGSRQSPGHPPPFREKVIKLNYVKECN